MAGGKAPQAKDDKWPLEAGKGKETVSPLEKDVLQEVHGWEHLEFRLTRSGISREENRGEICPDDLVHVILGLTRPTLCHLLAAHPGELVVPFRGVQGPENQGDGRCTSQGKGRRR